MVIEVTLNTTSMKTSSMFIVLLISILNYSCTQNVSQGIGQYDQNESTDPVDFPDTESGKLLKEHVRLMSGMGEFAEANYQRSLEKLKRRPGTYSRELFNTYQRVEEKNYDKRWAIVYTMTKLETDSSFNYLSRIVQKKLPSEKWDDAERFSQGKEINILATALEGIGYIAKKYRSQKADELLLTFISHPETTLKREAIQGYLGSENDQKRKKYLLDNLEDKYHYLVTLKTTDPKVIPYPQMPSEFKLDNNGASTDSPKVKQ